MIKSKILVVLALAGISALSLGLSFNFNSHGTFTNVAGVITVSDPNIDFDTSDIAVTALDYIYTDTASTAGTGTLSVTGGTIDFAFTGTITYGSQSDALGGVILTFANGTGVLAGMTGAGSLSNTTWKAGSRAGTDQSTFVAEVVPEPASMAALGLGAAALLRRRRRKP